MIWSVFHLGEMSVFYLCHTFHVFSKCVLGTGEVLERLLSSSSVGDAAQHMYFLVLDLAPSQLQCYCPDRIFTTGKLYSLQCFSAFFFDLGFYQLLLPRQQYM